MLMTVLWDMAESRFGDFPWFLTRDIFGVDGDFPTLDFTQSRNRLDEFRLAIAVNPSDSDNLPFPDGEVQALHFCNTPVIFHDQVFDMQYFVLRIRRAFLRLECHLTTDHQCRQLFWFS